MRAQMRQSALAATLVLATSAYAAPCAPWANPGADKNTQWPELSVLNYKLPQGQALHDLIKERAYTEIARVRTGKLVGESTGTEYLVSDMHYGAGKHCTGPVELTPDAEGEFGFVYESGGQFVWVPWVCNNVSLLTRVRTLSGSAPVGQYVTDSFEGGGYLPISGAPSVDGGSSDGGGVVPFIPTPLPYVGGGYYVLPTLSVTPAVPEPSTYFMLLVGLVAVALYRYKGR